MISKLFKSSALVGLVSIAAACSSVHESAEQAPTAWEHGWKTERVIATRYANPYMGYNIGFRFPKNLYNGDQVEVFKFVEERGGHVYEGGGHPGAEMFTVFDGVVDRESADAKLKTLLPEFDKFMRDLR